MGAGPAYPFMPLLAPFFKGLDPASPISLVKVKEVIGMFAYQLHMASQKAMANLGLFKGEHFEVGILDCRCSLSVHCYLVHCLFIITLLIVTLTIFTLTFFVHCYLTFFVHCYCYLDIVTVTLTFFIVTGKILVKCLSLSTNI